MITSGRETASSNPSRRMVSMSTDKWSSPRPDTLYLSGVSPGSTRSATLKSSSRSRRSLILRVVTYLPSRPANGESLTWKVMLIVGSSTDRGVIASTFSGSQIVSEILSLSMPEIQTISPAAASSTSIRSRPRWLFTCRILPLRCLPSTSTIITCWFVRATPRVTRPIPMTPT